MKNTLSFFLNEREKQRIQMLAKKRFLNFSSFVKTIIMSTDFKKIKIKRLSRVKDFAETVSITYDQKIFDIIKQESVQKNISHSTVLTSAVLDFLEKLEKEV